MAWPTPVRLIVNVPLATGEAKPLHSSAPLKVTPVIWAWLWVRV